VRIALNRASVIPPVEAACFRMDTAGLVTLQNISFPWLSISPKLHILMFHDPVVLETFGSIGLDGKQGTEACRGRYGQNAVTSPGATELQRAVSFLRAMAFAREGGSDVSSHHMSTCKPAAVEVRKETQPGDKRWLVNSPQLPVCKAKTLQAAKKRKLWAAGIEREAPTTVGAFLCQWVALCNHFSGMFTATCASL